jgi:hypothetical protein
MMITLGEAYRKMGRFVESGITGRATIVDRINEAIERLIVEADWKDTVQWIRVGTSRQTIPVPREFEVLVRAAVDGVPVSLWGPGYEFMASGPGDLEIRGGTSALNALINLGSYFASMYDIPKVFSGTPASAQNGYTLMAFARERADAGKTLTVRGLGSDMSEVYVDAAPGETLTINQWGDGVPGRILGALSTLHHSARTYRELTACTKPVTAGYVWLYAVDLATSEMFLLSAYHPDDTLAQVRRYRFTTDMGPTGDVTSVLALGKRKALPAIRDTDVLLIQSLPAIKHMLIAIREENTGNLNNARVYIDAAKAILTSQLGEERHSQAPVIIDVDRTCRESAGMTALEGGF